MGSEHVLQSVDNGPSHELHDESQSTQSSPITTPGKLEQISSETHSLVAARMKLPSLHVSHVESSSHVAHELPHSSQVVPSKKAPVGQASQLPMNGTGRAVPPAQAVQKEALLTHVVHGAVHGLHS